MVPLIVEYVLEQMLALEEIPDLFASTWQHNREKWLSYQACDVPDIDWRSPLHLEYDLAGSVDVWLNKRPAQLSFVNPCFAKIT